MSSPGITEQDDHKSGTPAHTVESLGKAVAFPSWGERAHFSLIETCSSGEESGKEEKVEAQTVKG
jgi:hypothetical protein